MTDLEPAVLTDRDKISLAGNSKTAAVKSRLVIEHKMLNLHCCAC
jgi:hypothetical protein